MAGDRPVASGQLQVLLSRIRQGGMWWLIRKAVKRITLNLCWLLLLPLACVLHLIGVRRLTIHTDRIGHLASEPDCFLKLRAMGVLPARRCWFALAPPHRVANAHLLRYWQRHMYFVTHPVACGVLYVLSLRGPMCHRVDDYILSFETSARYYSVNAEWGDRPALLTLDAADRAGLRSLLAGLGLPEGAWFVCFHNRESSYSPADEVIHAHRNASIESYAEAMRFVVAQGGWCIRMGDPGMQPLPQMPGVVDYAHHALRSDSADVLLCAGCRYFVGSSSGLWSLASVFGVRSALANMIPVSTLGYMPGDISIPKLLREAHTGELIPFPRLFDGGLANLRVASSYKGAGIVPVENESADIYDLVAEMHRRISSTWNDAPDDDRLQTRFRGLMRPHDYGYASGARINTYFLRRYQALLQG